VERKKDYPNEVPDNPFTGSNACEIAGMLPFSKSATVSPARTLADLEKGKIRYFTRIWFCEGVVRN